MTRGRGIPCLVYRCTRCAVEDGWKEHSGISDHQKTNPTVTKDLDNFIRSEYATVESRQESLIVAVRTV
jgi:hypothetical protein